MDAINEATRILGKHFSSISFEMEDCSFTYRPDEFIIHKMKAAKASSKKNVRSMRKMCVIHCFARILSAIYTKNKEKKAIAEVDEILSDLPTGFYVDRDENILQSYTRAIALIENFTTSVRRLEEIIKEIK